MEMTTKEKFVNDLVIKVQSLYKLPIDPKYLTKITWLDNGECLLSFKLVNSEFLYPYDSDINFEYQISQYNHLDIHFENLKESMYYFLEEELKDRLSKNLNEFLTGYAWRESLITGVQPFPSDKPFCLFLGKVLNEYFKTYYTRDPLRDPLNPDMIRYSVKLNSPLMLDTINGAITQIFITMLDTHNYPNFCYEFLKEILKTLMENIAKLLNIDTDVEVKEDEMS